MEKKKDFTSQGGTFKENFYKFFSEFNLIPSISVSENVPVSKPVSGHFRNSHPTGNSTEVVSSVQNNFFW